MKITRAAVSFLAGSSLLLISTSATFAQESSPSPSPSASPTSSPQVTPTPDPSPSSSPEAEGGTTKEEVLGESTVLGETSAQREIAKVAIAVALGLSALYLTVKTVRSKAEE